MFVVILLYNRVFVEFICKFDKILVLQIKSTFSYILIKL